MNEIKNIADAACASDLIRYPDLHNQQVEV